MASVGPESQHMLPFHLFSFDFLDGVDQPPQGPFPRWLSRRTSSSPSFSLSSCLSPSLRSPKVTTRWLGWVRVTGTESFPSDLPFAVSGMLLWTLITHFTQHTKMPRSLITCPRSQLDKQNKGSLSWKIHREPWLRGQECPFLVSWREFLECSPQALCVCLLTPANQASQG
jgi:hypothetical protein